MASIRRRQSMWTFIQNGTATDHYPRSMAHGYHQSFGFSGMGDASWRVSRVGRFTASGVVLEFDFIRRASAVQRREG